mmetsp:Transcript_7220/g.18787  ORF Transcript_7220/g.18787 Transcript_7220/m.18787 type:complete len:263 (-) Transcript_7220:765-1553(-)
MENGVTLREHLKATSHAAKLPVLELSRLHGFGRRCVPGSQNVSARRVSVDRARGRVHTHPHTHIHTHTHTHSHVDTGQRSDWAALGAHDACRRVLRRWRWLGAGGAGLSCSGEHVWNSPAHTSVSSSSGTPPSSSPPSSQCHSPVEGDSCGISSGEKGSGSSSSSSRSLGSHSSTASSDVSLGPRGVARRWASAGARAGVSPVSKAEAKAEASPTPALLRLRQRTAPLRLEQSMRSAARAEAGDELDLCRRYEPSCSFTARR